MIFYILVELYAVKVKINESLLILIYTLLMRFVKLHALYKHINYLIMCYYLYLLKLLNYIKLFIFVNV